MKNAYELENRRANPAQGIPRTKFSGKNKEIPGFIWWVMMGYYLSLKISTSFFPWELPEDCPKRRNNIVGLWNARRTRAKINLGRSVSKRTQETQSEMSFFDKPQTKKYS